MKRIWGEVKAAEKKDKGKHSPACSIRCRARCRPWWRRSRSPRAPPARASTGRIPSRCSRSCTKSSPNSPKRAQAVGPDELENELGDLLFVLVNLARFVKVDPEQALRRTNAKFRKRFGYIERKLAERGKTLRGIQHRGNGGAVAGSQAVIEIRQLLPARRSSKTCCGCSRRIWGFADIELLPLRFLVVVSKVGGPRVRRVRRRRMMVGFCFAIPGIKPGGQPYLHSHMLGVLPEYRNAGVGRRLKLRAARGGAGARHPADRVDLRSAGAEERLLQHRAAGRDRAALSARISTASRPARCTAGCPPIAASPNGGSIRRAWGRCSPGSGWPTAPRSASRIPPISRAFAHDDRDGARRIQQDNAERFQDAFARGLAVTGFERTGSHGTYLLEPWQ